MSDYRVIFEDPDYLDEPARILIPAPEWVEGAMAGHLPEITVYWAIQEAEEKFRRENPGETFVVPEDMYMAQFTSPRIGPMSEEEAIEYLIMKDIPKRVWGKQHNRQMFKIVKAEDLPTDRVFRNAWKMTEE